MHSNPRHEDGQATHAVPYVLLSREETALPALPFFTLAYAHRRRKQHLTFETKLARHNVNATLRWQVSADPVYGFPDAFDRKVFKIIEYLAMEPGVPIRNPVHFSLRQILDLLGLAPFGSHFARVRSSIRRIAAVTLYTRMTFREAQHTGRHSRTFHLYDTVSFREEAHEEDIGAERHALVLGAWYLDNMNRRYIRPVDPGYFRLIRNPVASRLHELLTLKFEEVFRRNLGGWQVAYPALCRILPLDPCKFSPPQRQLGAAHQALISTGFLDRVEWDRIDGTWILLYAPGSRAREAHRPRLADPEGRALPGPHRETALPASKSKDTPRYKKDAPRHRRQTPRVLTPRPSSVPVASMDAGTEEQVLHHWKLTEQPFGSTPDPKFYYPIGQHQEALFKLQHTVTAQTGAMMLSGECGCGKTLLTRTLFHGLDPKRYDVALLTNPRWKGVDLLREVLYQLGQEVKTPDKNLILHRMEEQWLKTYRGGRHTVLIIDEAQLIDDFETLEELRLLLNFQLDDRYLLTLILVGQPELNDHIDAIPQFEQRLVFRHHLASMSQEETQAYILHRLQVAGMTREVFTRDAFACVHALSGGVPRRVNTLCRVSLLTGWARRCETLDAAVITAVAASRTEAER